MKTNPPAVTIVPPKFSVPVGGTPRLVSSADQETGDDHGNRCGDVDVERRRIVARRQRQRDQQLERMFVNGLHHVIADVAEPQTQCHATDHLADENKTLMEMLSGMKVKYRELDEATLKESDLTSRTPLLIHTKGPHDQIPVDYFGKLLRTSALRSPTGG